MNFQFVIRLEIKNVPNLSKFTKTFSLRLVTKQWESDVGKVQNVCSVFKIDGISDFKFLRLNKTSQLH